MSEYKLYVATVVATFVLIMTVTATISALIIESAGNVALSLF